MLEVRCIKHMSTVLVVDDQPLDLELIVAFLEKDYNVISARGGKEALEKIESEKPDIVLLDIMMPGISGYEICKKIKQQYATRFTPVVMVTALSEFEDKIKAIEADADDFLTKPINSIELITRINSLLKSKYFHDQLIKSKEKIEAQNQFKTIMANLLPFLLQNINPDKKNDIIWHMSKQVEEVIWTKYIHDMPADTKQTAGTSCNIMNLLGGDFSVEAVSENGYTIKNNRCPWGESNNLNPVLCMLTRSIFARISIRVYRNINVNIKKTIAGGDGYCLIDVSF